MMDPELEALLRDAPDPESFEPSGPEWIAVEGSSNVAAVIFWVDLLVGAHQGTLGMRFLNGGEYHYLAVGTNVYRALLHAQSKGKAQWELIRRGGYTFRVITPPRKNWRKKQ